MTTVLMNSPAARTTKPSAFFAKAGRVALALLVLALAAAVAVTVRVFVFEYLHGDERPLQGLVRLIANSSGI